MPLFLRIALLLSLCFMVACLPSRGGRGGDGDDDDSAADDDDAASDDDDAASDDDDAAANGEAECLDLGGATCVECMQELYPVGYNNFLNDVYEFVYCGSACGFLCADFCMDPNAEPSQACGTCAGEIGLDSPDGQDFQDSCSQDPDCATYFVAQQSCFQ
jgi:hypothetical protein